MGIKISCCRTVNNGDSSDYLVYVRTGDKKNSGTDSNVYIELKDSDGQTTGRKKLDVRFRNDFERGHTDVFKLPNLPRIEDISEIEIFLDESGVASDWYLDKICVEHKYRNQSYFFPCHRWIRETRALVLAPYDSCLPQNSPHKIQRQLELEHKKEIYHYAEKYPGLQIQVKELPEDEVFSDDYQWDLMKRKMTLIVEKTWASLTSGDQTFTSLDDVRALFSKFPSLEEPPGIHMWTSDVRFGDQRLNSCNPKLVKLCTKIPEHFGIDSTEVKPFLEGWTLQTALDAQRLFIVDLKILEGINTVGSSILCTPLALLFLTSDKTLVPVAIQLFQQKGPENPVFYPSDDPYLWILAKMWYNNADASYHQACVHLGSTHLTMEGISVCTQRNLSPSHPVYKLLAPHFLYLIAINTRGLSTLISPGGWVDKTMTIGREGILQLMAKKHQMTSVKDDLDFVQDLQARGVYKDSVLPNYHYRDDALLLYQAVTSYVKKMINLFYPNTEDIVNDEELQNWAQELVAPRVEGLGLKGVPGDGKFTTHEQVIAIVRIIIFTCSVEHAAVNFSQYDSYAFSPNYPAYLNGVPPKNKDPKTEEDIVRHLPTKTQMLDSMVITKILSTRSTRALGDFEVVYHHEPKALKIVHEFQNELKEVSQKIRNNNEKRRFQYTLLDPATVPNSISI